MESIIKKAISYKLEIFILFIIICVSFFRSPFIFLNGRFIGEEATHHLLFALNNSFFNNLIYFDSVAGYYNLIPNLLTEISTYVPLEFAPLITVYGSFLIILNLSTICLFMDSYFLDNKIKKIVATFLLFATPPFVPEIWINSLNSQIYLCLTVILILFVRNIKNDRNFYLNFNIFIASLSGIYSCVLTPFFLIRFLYAKTKYNLINFIILLCSTIIQVALILYSRFSNNLHETKFDLSLNLDHLILFVYNNFSKPVFGRQLTHLIYEKTNLIILCVIIFFIVAIFIYQMLKKENINKFKKDVVLQFLFLSFIIYSIVILIGSVDTQLGGRYAVLLGSIFLLIILRLVSFFDTKLLKIILISFLATSILTGIYEFRPPTKNVRIQYIKFLDCVDCPIWKEEVKKWRKDKNYIIGLWPYPRKKLRLIINN